MKQWFAVTTEGKDEISEAKMRDAIIAAFHPEDVKVHVSEEKKLSEVRANVNVAPKPGRDRK